MFQKQKIGRNGKNFIKDNNEDNGWRHSKRISWKDKLEEKVIHFRHFKKSFNPSLSLKFSVFLRVIQ